jgi:hypothetical protein
LPDWQPVFDGQPFARGLAGLGHAERLYPLSAQASTIQNRWCEVSVIREYLGKIDHLPIPDKREQLRF